MKLPINFKEFKESPIAGLLFLSVVFMGYMYFDKEAFYKEVLEEKTQTITALRKEVKRLNQYIIDIIR